MASKTASEEYRNSAVFGNVAYDLSKMGYAYPYPYEQEYELPQKQEKTAVKTAARPASHIISAFSVIGFALTAALMVMVLLSYVRLAEISLSISDLEAQMTELSSQEKALTVEYEKAFNLSAVEHYAVYELGMVKPADGQIKTIDMERSDRAEILSSGKTNNDGLLNKTTDFLASLLAYFR